MLKRFFWDEDMHFVTKLLRVGKQILDVTYMLDEVLGVESNKLLGRVVRMFNDKDDEKTW